MTTLNLPDNKFTKNQDLFVNISKLWTKTPEDEEVMDQIYKLEALKDGNKELNEQEALTSYKKMTHCEQGIFLTGWYSSDCIENLLTSLISQQNNPDALRKNQLERTFRAIGDSQFASWLWQQTEDSPLLQDVLFFNPPCRENLKKLAQLTSLFPELKMQIQKQIPWWKQGLREEVVNAPYTARPSGMNFEIDGSIHSTHLLHEYLAKDLSETIGLFLDATHFTLNHNVLSRDDLLNIFSGTNQVAQMNALKPWVLFHMPPEPLMKLVELSTNPNLVKKTLVALCYYSDPKVADFFVEKIIHGGFDLSFEIRCLIPFSKARRLIQEKAKLFSKNQDPFFQTVGAEMTKAFDQMKLDEENQNSLLEHFALETMISLFDGKMTSTDTFTTSFFRFPNQIQWALDYLKELVQNKNTIEPIKLVFIGASFGPEVYSLVMALDHDFLIDPVSWEGINPLDHLEIYSTDIDKFALAYTERGEYVSHPSSHLSDIGALPQFAEDLGIDMDRYFEISENKHFYRVKPEWKSHVHTEFLDVLNPDSFIFKHGYPNGVFYNMVDGHLMYDDEVQSAALKVTDLAKDFIISAPRTPFTLPMLQKKMMCQATDGISHFFIPSESELIYGKQ